LIPQKTVNWDGGRVWPQYVKQYTGANVYDYAVAGAVCDKTFANTGRNGVKQNQIPAFLADNSFVNATTSKPVLNNPSATTVYAIWIGTNDIGNGAFLTEDQPRGLALTSFTDCVFAQLDSLYAAGARNFVLLNLPPLDLSPQYALPENAGVSAPKYWTTKTTYNPNITQTSEKMREYSTLLNAIYQYQIPYQVKIARRYPTSTFRLYDVHALVCCSLLHYLPSLLSNAVLTHLFARCPTFGITLLLT
jgi:phospholipase/lecithinase/hemolysin